MHHYLYHDAVDEFQQPMTQPNSRNTHRSDLVVADFPGKLPRAIGRTYNKTDADDQVRFLKRRMANGSFYVVFDPEPARNLERS